MSYTADRRTASSDRRRRQLAIVHPERRVSPRRQTLLQAYLWKQQVSTTRAPGG